MLEILVLSLGFTDQSYFGKDDLRDRFYSLLENVHDQRVAVVMGTPVVWDMGKYCDMPVYIAYKWSKGPNIAPVFPPDDGYIVCSSVTNDEIRILPLVDNSHKTPSSETLSPTPPPPGINPNKLTVSFDGLCNGFSKNDMEWAGEEIAVAVVCGPAISNVRNIKLVNNQPVKSTQVPDPIFKGKDYYYVKSKHSPQIPLSPGIAFAETEKVKIEPGKKKHWIWSGHFFVPTIMRYNGT